MSRIPGTSAEHALRRDSATYVFYDVENDANIVVIRAVGWKEHNRLLDSWKGVSAVKTIDVDGEPDEAEFQAEVEATGRNHELLALLEERSRETKRIPLAEVRKRLGLD